MPHATSLKFGPPSQGEARLARVKKEKEKEKEGLLPVRGLNILKADSRGRCIPCHADVVEDLVGRVAAPATKAKFYWVDFPYFT